MRVVHLPWQGTCAYIEVVAYQEVSVVVDEAGPFMGAGAAQAAGGERDTVAELASSKLLEFLSDCQAISLAGYHCRPRWGSRGICINLLLDYGAYVTLAGVGGGAEGKSALVI